MRWQAIGAAIALLLATRQSLAQENSADSTTKSPGESAAPAASYDSKAGPFNVQTVEKLVLNDAQRNKDLQLRINYPVGSGPLPVIVFSHGAYGSKDNYLALTEFWASHGYVTIQPTHSDSLKLGMKLRDPKAFQDWQSRPADVSIVLDSFDELEAQVPGLKGKLDRRHIGVGGHSFGANTAQLIGGAKAYLPLAGGEKSFTDDRASAVLLMSGQGPGEMLTEKSWQDFRRPMLVMSGSADGPTRTGHPAEWRKQPYELSPPGDKYLVWISGLDHGYGGITGGNLSGRNQPNDDHIRYTKIATLAFWDAYLKDSQPARAFLKSNQLEALSDSAIEVQFK